MPDKPCCHHEKSASPVQAIHDENALYTCPMHPQIRQQGPGSCPICGMALEPETITPGNAPDPELTDMTQRFWVSALLSLPLLIMTMGAHFIPLLPHDALWFQMAVATPVVLWGGWPFFVRGWASLQSRNLNMFTLIAIGVGIAYMY